MGIGYMALWGLEAKCWSGVGEWSGVDTPQTVMTTRAPAVLKKLLQLLGVNGGAVLSGKYYVLDLTVFE